VRGRFVGLEVFFLLGTAGVVGLRVLLVVGFELDFLEGFEVAGEG